jgi:protein KTI12
MPLIIVVGRPCTGKTTFSQRLAEYLRRHLPAAAAADGVRGVAASQVQEPTVELINEESLNINKRAGYSSSLDEKHTRSALKAVVTNKLTGACCVIVDSLNYIKGYRYELYCSARSLR